jgi:hypothetical protein
MRKHLSPGVVLGSIAIVLAMTGSATAGALITSAKIKDGTIQNKDIKKGTIALDRLTPATQKAVKLAGVPGPAGANGAAGTPGAAGKDGAPGTTLQPSVSPTPTPTAAPSADHWGVVNRNTIGSPSAFLRSGPADPALGSGSLNINVRDGSEKAAWGNEVDSFAGGLFSNITALGFRVYTTGENISAGGASANMPSITFEVDPNIDGKASNYSSLVFMPNNTAANQWSGYIDATSDAAGFWGGTGSAFTGTKCDINGTRCTFTELQSYLNDGGDPATILTAAITKGRDFGWNGAVDGLRINSTVYDFEETGVSTVAP